MQNSLRLLASIVFLLIACAGPAYGRSAELVDLGMQKAYDSNGELASAEAIEQAIITGGRTLDWRVSDREPGRISLRIDVRGKHTAVVAVLYSQGQFEIRYQDSTNLNYGEKGGKRVIHPNYNRWVMGLQQAIFKALP